MIAAVLQARFSSTRLPGKVLRDLHGAPMLARQIERIRRAKQIDRLIVATSTDPADDAIAALCRQIGVDCFRGSLNDVLDRFYGAVKALRPEYVVRLTGDCPLADPELIDQVIALARGSGADYASNIHPPTFPDGLDVEAVAFPVLERLAQTVTSALEREHVTYHIAQNLGKFRTENLARSPDLSLFRWTVDEPEDFRFVEAIYGALYDRRPDFAFADVLALLKERPELAEVNARFTRNEGLKRQLEALRTQK